jgi:CRISPR-associated protein Csb2
MPTTLAIRFPLGRYHANPWDRAVNEGATEWPPSPWRILRALVATWHTRWPDLPESAMDRLLDALADPPSYRTPPVGTGHTRHYLSDLLHRKAETGNTDLTLDPFLVINRSGELLVRWDADLDGELRQTLAKLTELLPYLGRAESQCEARLLEEDIPPDESWWRPDTTGGPRQTRLLAATGPVSRQVLEATTDAIRRQKRTVPPGTRWVSYAAGDAVTEPERRPVGELPIVTAIRFAVVGRAPLMVTHGVLLADEAHRQVGNLLEKAGVPDERRKQIMGTRGVPSGHRHAHWIPVGGTGETAGAVRNLVIWMPDGLRTEEVRAVLGLRSMSGRRGGEDGYEVRGFPSVEVLFQAAGRLEDVAPELCGPAARRWRSVTPYLPVRHRKRETIEEYLAADVAAELSYRGRADAVLTHVEPAPGMTARMVNQFRRYRTKERLRQSRPGTGLVLEFESPIAGPLLLGQLSHFGFGVFEPHWVRTPRAIQSAADG